MKRRSSIYYSADQRSEIWDRWLAGESVGRLTFIATAVSAAKGCEQAA
jgi:hypothetical protein